MNEGARSSRVTPEGVALGERRLSVDLAISSIKHTVSSFRESSNSGNIRKRNVLIFVVLISVLDSAMKSFENTTIGGVLNLIFVTCATSISALLLAFYAYPKHKISKVGKALLSLTVLLRMTLYANSRFKENYSVDGAGAAASLFYIVMTLEFGRWSQTSPTPPITFVSILTTTLMLATCVGLFSGSNLFMTAKSEVFISVNLVSLAIAYVLLLLVAISVIFHRDQPLKSSRRITQTPEGPKRHIVSSDGYYLVLLVYLMAGSSVAMVVLISSAHLRTAIKSLYVQIFSILLVLLSQPLAIGATDKKRFGFLMLGTYVTADFIQGALYLEEEILSSDFLMMLCLQELSGIVKNSGVGELLGYFVGIQKKNPYRDPEKIDIMLRRGVVDTMSEVLSVVAISSCYIAEIAMKDSGYLRPIIVSRNETAGGPNSIHRMSTVPCAMTCLGWNFLMDEPAPPQRSILDVTLLYALIVIVRAVSIVIERTIVLQIQSSVRKEDNKALQEKNEAIKAALQLAGVKTERQSEILSQHPSSNKDEQMSIYGQKPRISKTGAALSGASVSAKEVFNGVSMIHVMAMLYLVIFGAIRSLYFMSYPVEMSSLNPRNGDIEVDANLEPL